MFNQSPQKIIQTNRLPFLIGIIVLILVMGVFLFKAQMNQKRDIVESKPRQSLDISPKAEEASWFNDEKFRNIKINADEGPLRQPTAQQVETRIISREDVNLRKQEIEDEYSTDWEIKKIDDKNRIEEKKLEIEAMKSPLSIDVPPPPGAKQVSQKGQASTQDDLTGGLSDIINMIKNEAGGKTSAVSAALPSLMNQLASDLNNQAGKQAFLTKTNEDDDYLKNSKKKPRSRYEVKAGTYIPAALITGINSDLPGSVNAQVTENVYDTVTGNYLLIPQGAKLIGEYNSSLTYGQNRVQVVWDRIIFPDGQSIDLERMQGMDIGGYTGFYDKVNNHYFRIYGSAILLSLMGAGYDILNQQQEQSTDARSAVAANVGQKLSDVSGEQLQKNMDIQPTVIIDPGYKFRIFVMKDMVLENIRDVEGTLAYTE